jgi:hypothetical protein
MAKATIKSSSGALITIEGTDAEVANIIGTFEKTAVVGRTRQEISKHRAAAQMKKKRMGASDLIIGLNERGYFEKPKTLSEISAALEEEGFLYPVTTLSGVVLGLVKQKHLRRKKIDGKWAYGK